MLSPLRLRWHYDDNNEDDELKDDYELEDDHEVEDSEEYKSDTEEVDDFPELSSSNLSSQLSHQTESKEGFYVFLKTIPPTFSFSEIIPPPSTLLF